jgi:hypothetical protein
MPAPPVGCLPAMNPRASLLAVVLTLFATAASAKQSSEFDPAQAGSLQGLPVRIGMAREAPFVQVLLPPPGIFSGFFPKDNALQVYSLRLMSTDAPLEYQIPASVFGLALFWNKQLRLNRELIAPSVAALEAGGCLRPVGTQFNDAVERAVRATPWGSAAAIQQVGPDTVVGGGARYDFHVINSLTTDLAALVTVVDARAYSPTLPGAPGKWEEKPAWADQLVIVSDVLDPNPKTDADKAAALARENARYATLGVPALIARANDGDSEARRLVVNAQSEHKIKLRRAGSEDEWMLQDRAAKRARLWVEDGCSRLEAAKVANAAEAERMLGLLFAGKLDGTQPNDWSRSVVMFTGQKLKRNVAEDAAQAQQRQVFRDKAWRLFVSRRWGDDPLIDFRLSMLQDVDPAAPTEAELQEGAAPEEE